MAIGDGGGPQPVGLNAGIVYNSDPTSRIFNSQRIAMIFCTFTSQIFSLGDERPYSCVDFKKGSPSKALTGPTLSESTVNRLVNINVLAHKQLKTPNLIKPSKMEVAPQGCLNVIIQKTKIKLIE